MTATAIETLIENYCCHQPACSSWNGDDCSCGFEEVVRELMNGGDE
jgi:hypothetical protein